MDTLTATAEPKAEALAPQGTVFIVDDDADIRRAISLLVRSVDLHTEVYASPHEFLEDFDSELPSCLVLDVRIPGMTGLQLQQELNDRGIRIPTIFVSAHGEIASATAAMRAGAIDFLAKPFSPQELLDRIHEAIAVDSKQRRIQQSQREVELQLETLTDREREVMQYLAAGKSTKVIANRLGISSKTVDNHRGKILEKMCVDNPTQLAHVIAESSP